ncbi:unnamed protein product [Urochloa humidicola]
MGRKFSCRPGPARLLGARHAPPPQSALPRPLPPLRSPSSPPSPLLSARPPPPSPTRRPRQIAAPPFSSSPGTPATLTDLAHRDPSVDAASARAKKFQRRPVGNLPVSPATASALGLALHAAPCDFLFNSIQSGLAILEFANFDADLGLEGATA